MTKRPTSGDIGVQRPFNIQRLLGYSGDLLTVSASRPLPPGSRVMTVVPLGEGAATLLVSGKVVSSLPLSDGSFKVAVRIHSLAREQRAALIAAAAEADADRSSR